MFIEGFPTEVNLRGISGKVTVKLDNSLKNIEVTTTNEDKLDIVLNGDTLFINSKEQNILLTNKRSTNNVFTSVFGGMMINNQTISGNVIINGNLVGGSVYMESVKVDMIIAAPYNTFENFDITGSLKFYANKVSDKISVDSSGSSYIEIGHADFVHLDSSGSSDVIIAGASNVNLDISGSSKVNINSQGLKHLTIDSSGSSTIIVRGDIEKLDADLSGSTTINIYGLVKKQNIDQSGSSKVRIH